MLVYIYSVRGLAVEAKPDANTCSKEVVVNALKQITQKRYVFTMAICIA